MKKTTVKFAFERATKTTFRFREKAPEGEELIGTLYVKQRVFGNGKEPKNISVTIESE